MSLRAYWNTANRQTCKAWNDACRWAKRILAGHKQENYFWYVIHHYARFRRYLNEHKLWEMFRLRCESYRYGLISSIFSTLRWDQ